MRILSLNSNIHFTAKIHESVVIGHNCSIGREVIIKEGAFIANNVDIQSYAVIYENVTIGNNTDIGTGTQILANSKILNNVDIGSRVMISENTVIDNNATIRDGSFILQKIHDVSDYADSDENVSNDGVAGVQRFSGGVKSLTSTNRGSPFNGSVKGWGPFTNIKNTKFLYDGDDPPASGITVFYIDGKKCVVKETWNGKTGNSYHIKFQGSHYNVSGENNVVKYNNIDLLAEYKKHLSTSSKQPEKPEKPKENMFIMIMRILGFVDEVKQPEEGEK